MTQEQIKKLQELKGLLDAGILSQEEFDAEKKKVLSNDVAKIQSVQPVQEKHEPIMSSDNNVGTVKILLGLLILSLGLIVCFPVYRFGMEDVFDIQLGINAFAFLFVSAGSGLFLQKNKRLPLCFLSLLLIIGLAILLKTTHSGESMYISFYGIPVFLLGVMMYFHKGFIEKPLLSWLVVVLFYIGLFTILRLADLSFNGVYVFEIGGVLGLIYYVNSIIKGHTSKSLLENCKGLWISRQ